MAPVASSSMKELRLKGSAFIRSHASKHGISNASRKLMSEVLLRVKDHYAHVHRVMMLEDDFKDIQVGGPGKLSKKKTFALQPPPTTSAAPVAILPQIPLPLTPLHFRQTMTNPAQIVRQAVTNILRIVQTMRTP